MGIFLAKPLSGFDPIGWLLPGEPLTSWLPDFLPWLLLLLMAYFSHAKNKRDESLNFRVLKFKSETPGVESKPRHAFSNLVTRDHWRRIASIHQQWLFLSHYRPIRASKDMESIRK